MIERILCLDKPLVRLAAICPQDRIAVVYIRLAQLDVPCFYNLRTRFIGWKPCLLFLILQRDLCPPHSLILYLGSHTQHSKYTIVITPPARAGIHRIA